MNKIYLITPNKLATNFYQYLPKILKTKKVKFLQLRCKNYNYKKINAHIKKILPITKKYKVKLIINDNASFVENFKTVGFHLGQKDLNKNDNKKFINKKNFFGITCHNSLNLAKQAMKLKPNYLAFGAFFQTKTKKTKYRATINVLKKSKKLKTKIVAIGGINNSNYKSLLKNGADYIAISGFIWKNKKYSPLEAIKLFK